LEAIGREQAAKIRAKADIETAQAERDAFVKEQKCSKEKVSYIIRYFCPLHVPTRDKI